METNKITKEQAIDLWFKFIESDNVIKYCDGGGMRPYSYFELRLIKKDYVLEKIRLMTNCLYEDPKHNYPIGENCDKKLITPFGDFELTIDEANRLRGSWVNRNKTKGKLTYDDLLNELK